MEEDMIGELEEMAFNFRHVDLWCLLEIQVKMPSRQMDTHMWNSEKEIQLERERFGVVSVYVHGQHM
jgi:hypothetical protein